MLFIAKSIQLMYPKGTIKQMKEAQEPEVQ